MPSKPLDPVAKRAVAERPDRIVKRAVEIERRRGTIFDADSPRAQRATEYMNLTGFFFAPIFIPKSCEVRSVEMLDLPLPLIAPSVPREGDDDRAVIAFASQLAEVERAAARAAGWFRGAMAGRFVLLGTEVASAIARFPEVSTSKFRGVWDLVRDRALPPTVFFVGVYYPRQATVYIVPGALEYVRA